MDVSVVPKYGDASGFFSPYPIYLAYVGDFDIIGYRRPMSYYREIVWGFRRFI
jgi:beta-galactosidase